MEFIFFAKGHPNVTSAHKTTFEFTKENEVGITGDCIIGVSSNVGFENFPPELRERIKNENTVIRVQLETENANDEIKGYGNHSLTLDHPTDIVCRKSDFTCSRTLMIKADKAAIDLKRELIKDLKEGKPLKIRIIV